LYRLNNLNKESNEVLYSNEIITRVDGEGIGYIKKLSIENDRKKIRLCTHNNKNESIHEMFIVHEYGAYVRPHKHPGKIESTHIIEGVVDLVIFDDNGNINDVIKMGDYASGNIFYYRIAAPIYHTLIIKSDILVFHETTNGPFNSHDTVFPLWAPVGNNDQVVSDYMNELAQKIKLK